MAIFATIEGRLTRDPELFEAGSGLKIVKFGLASNKSGKKDEATFLSCAIFGKQGAVALEHLKKGQFVVVNGELSAPRVVKDGQEKTYIDLTVNAFRFGPREAPAGEVAAAPATSGGADDLPF